MMPQNKYGTVKNNTQMTATATLATTSSIRVESATQSDGTQVFPISQIYYKTFRKYSFKLMFVFEFWAYI